jgi:tryptophanyl-tRNA synthetase
MQTLFTGIKPSGNLHIGNYIGAIHNGLKVSEGRSSFFCVVDQHAITVDWDPKELNRLTKEITTIYLASGFNLNECSFFIQSHNYDHAYLGWLLNCVTPMGWANAMTQFKDKAKGKDESVSMGLYDYPVLMAADILLYNTDIVPVGEDQVQHVELTRDIAKKFNNLRGETFKLPKAVVNEHGARIRSLQHPEKKMSKSDNDQSGCVYLLDTPDVAVKKIMRAVTDSESTIGYDPENRIAVSNLIEIYSVFSGKSIDAIVAQYEGQGYGAFKKDLAEVMYQFLTNFQKRYFELNNDQHYIKEVLDAGLTRATSVSNEVLKRVKEKIGFVL